MSKIDYSRSIVSIPNSFLKHYGIEPLNKTNPILDQLLLKNKKNVIFLCIDGLSTTILDKHFKQLKKGHVGKMQSVFPPTTVAATTSYMSGLYPRQHGWLGWSCYLENQNCDLFPRHDSYYKKPLINQDKIFASISYESIMTKIASKVESYYVSQFGTTPVKNDQELFATIKQLCATQPQKFIYAYINNPDHYIHLKGVDSIAVKNITKKIEAQIMALVNEVEDTIIIMSGDHGLVDVEIMDLKDYPDFYDCFEQLPGFELRCLNIKVKPDKIIQFKEQFNLHFKHDFILVDHQTYINDYLGPSDDHQTISSQVFDYVMIATTNKGLWYTDANGFSYSSFKAHHAGLSDDELEVPLIIFEK